MKRDNDLCRLILIEIETDGGFYYSRPTIHIPGYTDQDVSYNVRKLSEASLIEAEFVPDSDPDSEIEYWIPKQLTSRGHDLLDNVRSNSAWNKVMSRLAEIGGRASIDVIVDLANRIVRSQIDLAP